MVNSAHRKKAGALKNASIPGAPGQDPTGSPETLTLVTMSVQVQDVEVSLELRPHHDLLQRQRTDMKLACQGHHGL